MKVSDAGRNAACQALVGLFDAGGAGYLEIRSGTPPAHADDAVSGSLLATVVLGDPAFDTAGTAGAGVATAQPISVVQGVAAGVATWFRGFNGSGEPVEDGTISGSGGGGELELNTTTISIGVDVAVTSWTISLPES